MTDESSAEMKILKIYPNIVGYEMLSARNLILRTLIFNIKVGFDRKLMRVTLIVGFEMLVATNLIIETLNFNIKIGFWQTFHYIPFYEWEWWYHQKPKKVGFQSWHFEDPTH